MSLVATKTLRRNIYDEPLELLFIQDGAIARKLGRLYFQRALLKKSNQEITAKSSCVALLPSDFITITGDNYGGTHDMIIDRITITKDAAIELECTEFTDSIENYT
jgi:hypothetical protein